MPAHLARSGLLFGLLALAGCAGSAAPAADNADSHLFADALRQIGQLYIRPVSGRALVAAGAAHLSALDPAFAATPGPGAGSQATLVLTYAGRTVSSQVMPDSSDPSGLARFLDTAIATARQVSPRLANASNDIVDHAIFDGMTAVLDRFSRYSPPELARELRASRNGYGGVGITLDSSNDEFRITTVEPRGPADRAGIRPGDRVTAIDAVATAKHLRAWVVQHLRGPVGSAVAVTVARAAPEQIREFHFHREHIIRPAVTMARDGGIAIFRIGSFNQSTTELIADALTKAPDQPGKRITGIVLDLRGNPGGLLEQAVSLADLFVRHGPIIETAGRHPASHQYFAASGRSIAPRVPIVALVNGGSASAAEIVAAALQDIGRAVVVGSASYGKGTVQTVLRLRNDGELTLTWARLIAPSGYLLEAHGVVPTVCTSDLDDSPRALDIALQRAKEAAAPAFRAPQPRIQLDEHGWTELRRSCPPRHALPTVDIKVAERLLADPALYAMALRSLPAATALVQKTPGTPSGLSLTGSDRALNSGPR